MRLFIIALLTACKTEQPPRYHGIGDTPPDEVSCTWSLINKSRGECIADGHRLRCYREQHSHDSDVWYEISCAPYKVFR